MEVYTQVGVNYYSEIGYHIVENNPNFFVGNISMSAVNRIFNNLPTSVILKTKEEEIAFAQKVKNDYLLLYTVQPKECFNSNIGEFETYIEIHYNLIDSSVKSRELDSYIRKLILDRLLESI